MADIPHADGPYTEVTTYGVKKATAFEATRRFLEESELGWISAVSECMVRLINGKETCFMKVVTSTSRRLNVVVKLTTRNGGNTFPISSAEVRVIDYHLAARETSGGFPKLAYAIAEDGYMSIPK